jgi:hypothetical protein
VDGPLFAFRWDNLRNAVSPPHGLLISLRRAGQQSRQSDEVAGGGREAEGPSDPFDGAESRLSLPGGGFCPAEYFLDTLAYTPADRVTGMSGRASVDLGMPRAPIHFSWTVGAEPMPAKWIGGRGWRLPSAACSRSTRPLPANPSHWRNLRFTRGRAESPRSENHPSRAFRLPYYPRRRTVDQRGEPGPVSAATKKADVSARSCRPAVWLTRRGRCSAVAQPLPRREPSHGPAGDDAGPTYTACSPPAPWAFCRP